MRLQWWCATFSCVALAVASSACGSISSQTSDAGGSGGDAADADFTLAVDPSTVSIPIASETTVELTVDRSGDPGDIMLTADGLGSNLEVELSPNPLTGTATTATATIRAKGGTAAGTSTVTFTGTAGSKTHSATVSVTTTTITVTGTVRGARAGIEVGIIGKSSVFSGAGGVFTFTDVTPPYDLYTLTDSGCTSAPIDAVFFFDDLTATAPIVTAAAAPVTCNLIGVFCGINVNNPCPSSQVTANRSGPGNGTDRAVVVWSGGSFNNAMVTPTQITGSASWLSGTTNTGNLYSLQYTRKASEAPDTYIGFARSAQTTLTSGQAATIPLPAVTVNSTATLTGTVTPPQGYDSTTQMRQEFGTSSGLLWSAPNVTTVDATIPIIANAGGTNLFVQANLVDVGSSQYVVPLTGNTAVNFEMPPAAVLQMPAANATGVTHATTFSFQPGANTISEVVVSTTTASRLTYRIFTTNSMVQIPTIPNAMLPAAHTFNWSVAGYGPYTSINQAVGAEELETVSTIDFTGPAHAFTRSVTRTFTTP